MFTKKRLWVILTSVFAALTAVFIVGTSLAITLGNAAINKIFGTSNYVTVNDPNAKPTTFFASDYGEDFDGEDLFEEDKKRAKARFFSGTKTTRYRCKGTKR